jgi:hypothetical protein
MIYLIDRARGPSVMSGSIQEAFPERLAISDLRPTQMTVGMREVDIRRTRWQQRDAVGAAHYLHTHPVPVVVGPGNKLYMIDRHHLATALHEEGVLDVPIAVVDDIGRLGFEDFWTTLEKRNWTHPFDDNGHRRPFENMPALIGELTDDPFRSLAGAIKRAGGYAKSIAPFSEFRWADFFRERISRTLVERDFGRALAIGMNLAQSSQSAGLPGWQRHPRH